MIFCLNIGVTISKSRGKRDRTSSCLLSLYNSKVRRVQPFDVGTGAVVCKTHAQ